MKEIKSLKDPFIQMARKAGRLKDRMEERKVLLIGEEQINWAITQNLKIDFVLLNQKLFPSIGPYKSMDFYWVGDGLMKKAADIKYSIPVLAVATIKKRPPRGDFMIVLDDIQDYGNMGTIIRTAKAFGVDGFCLTNSSRDLYHKKTIDASRGKCLDVGEKVFENPRDTLDYLKQNNYQVVCSSPYGKNIQSLTELKAGLTALVLGNETRGACGIFMKNADMLIQVPLSGEVESLNVGVFAGISIYELKLKQVIAMIESNIKKTLGRELNVVSKLTQQALDREVKKVSPFSSKQVVFLMVLACDQMMEKDHVKKQFSVLEREFDDFVKPLLEAEYVKKNKEDYCITDMGGEFLGKMWNLFTQVEEKILDGFTREDKDRFMGYLKHIRENCVKLIEEQEN